MEQEIEKEGLDVAAPAEPEEEDNTLAEIEGYFHYSERFSIFI